MRPGVAELARFYDASSAGRVAVRPIRAIVGELWSDLHGLTLVGFGFALPFLTQWDGRAGAALALAPKAQGTRPWPEGAPNRTALVEEYYWPLMSASIERVLLVHAIEHCERPSHLLREVHRVLAPEGRVIAVTPNRRGVWARAEDTPFGHGKPYSARQIMDLLAESGLQVFEERAALYALPSARRFLCRFAPTLERIGKALDLRQLAGVTIVEAGKRVVAPRGKALPAGRRVRLAVKDLAPQTPEPAAQRNGGKG